jgi:hypothetical protein
MRRGRYLFAMMACWLSAAPMASAQEQQPIGHVAIDIHGIFARHKVEPVVATALDLAAGNLPKRSLGLTGGVHVYPWRWGRITFGAGVTYVSARGTEQLEIPEKDGSVTKGPKAIRHFSGLNPEFSINFGHRRGWSYVSGGMFGQSRMYVERAGTPVTPGGRSSTINYGAGARWFAREHLAFSIDIRWYSLKEQPVPDVLFLPASLQPATTLLVLAGGISIK